MRHAAPPTKPTPTRDDVQDRRLDRLKKEMDAQEKRLRAQEKAMQRQAKKTQALATFNYLFIDVTQKAQDLRAAAVRLGKAYSTAARRHRDAVAKQEQLKALELQLMYSVMSIAAAGAMSWATEAVKASNAIMAAPKLTEYEKVLQRASDLPKLTALAQRLKSTLTRRVSAHDLFTTVTSSTVSAGVGAVFSISPTAFPAPPNEPANEEPLEFQDGLVAQIDDLERPAMMFLHQMAEKIKGLPDDAWDKYDDSEFQKAYRKWKVAADLLAGVNDLPDERHMTDGLERFIWALWIPSLKRMVKSPGGCIYAGGDAVCWDESDVAHVEWERVRNPVNERFVTLGIETEDETHWSREEEDQMLIKWSDFYLKNVQPWVRGNANGMTEGV